MVGGKSPASEREDGLAADLAAEADDAWRNIGIARHHAYMVYDVAQSDTGRQAKDRRRIARKDLERLWKALTSLDDETWYAITRAEHELGFSFDQRALLNLVKKATEIATAPPGAARLVPFHAAARYLLQHYRVVHGKPTYSVHELSGARGKRYSAAVEFLNKEFQLLAKDKMDRREPAITIIKTWLKSRGHS